MPSFWLEYTQDGQRREFSFDSPSVSIGRDKGSDFVLDHPTVSRQHALIVSNPQGHQLVVLSRGGLTAIDGSQVSGEIELFDGSQIHFGQLAFTFRSQNAPRRPDAGSAGQGWGPQAGAQQSGAQWEQPQGLGNQSSSWEQPAQQSGGLQQPSGSYQQPGGSYQQPSGSYQQPSGSYQQPSGSFQQPDAGLQQPSGSYQQPSGSFQQPNTGNFGQPTNTGNFDQPTNGGSHGSFSGGGWESQVGQQGDDWGSTAAEDAGLMSWDEIAASADNAPEQEVDAVSAALTDFEKIKNAQEEAAKKSKSNPLMKWGGLVAIVGLLGLIGYTEFRPKKKKKEPGTIEVANDPPEIKWVKGDIDCVGTANCKAEALQAYRVGTDLCEQIDSAVGNRYECFMQYTKAEELLGKGGIENAPDEMKGYQETRDKLAKDLKARFQQLRANIYSDQKLKMWGNVVDKLNQVKATFPDKRCNYHQWALERERSMKEAGTYPQQPYVP